MFRKKDKDKPEFPSYIKLEGGRIRTDINEMLEDEEIQQQLEEIRALNLVERSRQIEKRKQRK